MPRYTGPIQFVYKGDVEVAQRYIPFARTLVGRLLAGTTVSVVSRDITLPEGVRIQVEGYTHRERARRTHEALGRAWRASRTWHDRVTSRERSVHRRSWEERAGRAPAPIRAGTSHSDQDLLDATIGSAVQHAAVRFKVTIDARKVDETLGVVGGYFVKLPFEEDNGGGPSADYADHVILASTKKTITPFVHSGDYAGLVESSKKALLFYEPIVHKVLDSGNIDWRGKGGIRLSWKGGASRSFTLGYGRDVFFEGESIARVPPEYGRVQGACFNGTDLLIATANFPPSNRLVRGDAVRYYLLKKPFAPEDQAKLKIDEGFEELDSELLYMDDEYVMNGVYPHTPVFFNESGTRGAAVASSELAPQRGAGIIWAEIRFTNRSIKLEWGKPPSHAQSIYVWVDTTTDRSGEGWRQVEGHWRSTMAISGSGYYANCNSDAAGHILHPATSYSTERKPDFREQEYQRSGGGSIPENSKRPIVVDFDGDKEIRMEFSMKVAGKEFDGSYFAEDSGHGHVSSYNSWTLDNAASLIPYLCGDGRNEHPKKQDTIVSSKTELGPFRRSFRKSFDASPGTLGLLQTPLFPGLEGEELQLVKGDLNPSGPDMASYIKLRSEGSDFISGEAGYTLEGKNPLIGLVFNKYTRAKAKVSRAWRESSVTETVRGSRPGVTILRQVLYADIRDKAYIYIKAEYPGSGTYRREVRETFKLDYSHTMSYTGPTVRNGNEGPYGDFGSEIIPGGKGEYSSPKGIYTYSSETWGWEGASPYPGRLIVQTPSVQEEFQSFSMRGGSHGKPTYSQTKWDREYGGDRYTFSLHASMRPLGMVPTWRAMGSLPQKQFRTGYSGFRMHHIFGWGYIEDAAEGVTGEYNRNNFGEHRVIKRQYSNHPEMEPLLYFHAPERVPLRTMPGRNFEDYWEGTPTWAEGMYIGSERVEDHITFNVDLRDHTGFVGLIVDPKPA